ncbi:carbon-nitrogen hydrolase family protein [Psychromonas sp. PT13]|uniref:carbon-nitrogen hydrolase family protein n=1 Tax=Psychromonas sp. PT13 TaxID=3439547 RepID=UPI003EB90ECA
MKIAAIQMSSKMALSANLETATKLIHDAVQSGAELVLLPEYFYCMGQSDTDRVALAEPYLKGPIQDFLAQTAKQHNIWLIAGSVPISSAQPEKFYNTQLLFNPEGICQGRYDKVHLFAFGNEAESYRESDTMMAGDSIVDFTVGDLRIRPSICYDLRFPEFYRQQFGYQLITVPAAFTYTTGKDHWELLLRTRAIENQCYLIAAAQTGQHENGSRTFGHSMIIDPWGRILSSLEEQQGVILAEIEMDELDKIRTQLPALNNRIFS